MGTRTAAQAGRQAGRAHRVQQHGLERLLADALGDVGQVQARAGDAEVGALQLGRLVCCRRSAPGLVPCDICMDLGSSGRHKIAAARWLHCLPTESLGLCSPLPGLGACSCEERSVQDGTISDPARSQSKTSATIATCMVQDPHTADISTPDCSPQKELPACRQAAEQLKGLTSRHVLPGR